MRPLQVTILLLLVLGLSVHAGQSAVGQQTLPLRDAVECRERGGLPNVFAKWKAGQEVRIAYLGGSITEQNGWRPKTLPNEASLTVRLIASRPGTGIEFHSYHIVAPALIEDTECSVASCRSASAKP